MTNIGAIPAIEAASKQPNGMDTTKMKGFTVLEIAHMAQKLCAAGTLHRAKLSHKVVRYFDTPERAAAYLQKHGAYSIKPKTPGRNASAFKAGEVAIVPDGVKVTMCSGYQGHRHSVDLANVPSYFALMPLGSTLEAA